MDTAYQLWDAHQVDSTNHCCIPALQDDPPDYTQIHGKAVGAITYYYAPEARFRLYQAAQDLNEDEHDDEIDIGIKQVDFGRAIEKAIEHDIDILNISAGHARPNCVRGNCIYCTQVEKALQEDIIVVAAAGNNDDNCVHCPSYSDDVISVGGVRPLCEHSMTKRVSTPKQKPPGAYWAKLFNGVDYADDVTDETFCSTRGCATDEGGCAENRTIEPWHNPGPEGEKPDVLAPVQYTVPISDSPVVTEGSSFASPLITGCLASILSSTDRNATPYRVRQDLRDTSSDVEASEAGLFDATAFTSELSGEPQAKTD